MLLRSIQSEFIKAAQKYIGVKFRHQGRSRLGVDCMGLVICAAKDIGYDLEPGVLNYSPNPGMSLYEGIKSCDFLEQITEEEMKDGDLWLINHMKMPIHIGIKHDYCIIHSYQPVNWVCEHGIHEKLRKRFHSFWRINWQKAPRIN